MSKGRYPKDVEGLNNTSFFYYRQVLLTKMFSVIRPVNIPENWDIDYIYDGIFTNGYICVCDTVYDVLPLKCGTHGINVFGKPTKCLIANPVIGSFEKTIDKDCVLIYFWNLNGQYLTINNIINRYASKLSNIDASINISLINSRVAHVFETNSEGEKRTIEKIYDDVSNGKPAIVVKKGQNSILNENTKNDFLNVKNTFIGNELMDMRASIMNEFLTEIGIKNANTTKRERLNGDEVNANNQETRALVDVWLETLNNCCKKVNKMFDLNIAFKLNENLTSFKKMGGDV